MDMGFGISFLSIVVTWRFTYRTISGPIVRNDSLLYGVDVICLLRSKSVEDGPHEIFVLL